MSKVLVTGCSGFLGREIFRDLSSHHTIISLGRTNSDISADLKNDVPVIKENIEYVIHAAGKAHVIPKNEQEEQEFYKTNYYGTINLCKAIDNLPNKPKAFIFISTVAVYGLESGSLITETYPKKGESPYAKSKIMAEEWLENWANERKIVLGILRLPLIAGNKAPGNLGMMVSGIKTGKYLRIGNGSARKSTVWVGDVPKVIPKLIEVGGIYNLTDGYHPSFRELEDVISQSFNKSKPKKIPLWFASLLANIGDIIGDKFPINSNKLNKITSDLTFCDEKAKKKLGWKPNRVLIKIKENLKD